MDKIRRCKQIVLYFVINKEDCVNATIQTTFLLKVVVRDSLGTRELGYLHVI